MEVVAESNYKQSLPFVAPMYKDTKDPYFEEFNKIRNAKEIIRHASYHKVIPSRKNFEIAFKKHDRPRISPENPLFDEVIRVGISYFSYLYNEPSVLNDVEFNMNTGAGVPFTQLGMRKKKEAFKQGKILTDLCNRLNHIPVDKDAPKIELLDIVDLENEKLRDIKVSYLPHLAAQKLFYDAQNKAIIENHMVGWIKYGAAKQYGGFHRMIKPLEKHPDRIQGDASRWDKSIFLGPCYQVRNAHLKINDELKELFAWAMHFVLNPYIMLPDGKIVKLKTGNCSGRNNTTTDNSIAHWMILVYLFFKLQIKAYPNEKPSLSTVFANAIFCIYSDDFLGSTNFEFYKVTKDEFIEIMRETYAEFGLEMKLKAFLITQDVKRGRISKEHEFLGSYCYYIEEYERYIPYPRFGKVCASLTLTPLNKLNVEDFFQRVLNLVLLSYPNPEVFEEGLDYLRFLYNHKDFLNIRWRLDEILSINNLDVESRASFERLYLGFEGPQRPNVNISVRFKNGRLEAFKTNLEMNGRHQPNVILNKAIEQGHLTKGGLDFLRVACDPCPDGPRSFTGVPDMNSGQSLAFSVTQELNLVKPPTFVAGSNWSARIGNHPFGNNYVGNPGISRGQFSQRYIPTTSSNMHSVAINLAQDGTDFAYGNTADTSFGINLPASYTEGNVRICAMGIEVINTTAELQLQGLCTIATMPQPDCDSFMANLGGEPNTVANINVFPVRSLPKNLNEMVLYDNHLQWHAKDGAYCPVKVKPLRAVTAPGPSAPLVYTDNDPNVDTATMVATIQPFWLNITLPGNTTNVPILPMNILRFPSDSSVIMLTGLSEQTTLTVRVKFWVERFPSDAEAEILPLTRATARFDPAALEIYSKWVCRSPPGCKFTENPSGEWWKKTLGSLASLAGPLVSLIPHPLAKAAGGAMALGAPLLLESAEADKAKRKKKNEQRVQKGQAPKNNKGKRKDFELKGNPKK